MSYYLARRAVLKWLEIPSVYQIAKDELYELDSASFHFLKTCASDDGCVSKNSAFLDYCLEEGLLTTTPGVVQRAALKQAPEPSLRYLELQITDACNLKCKHCYIDNADRNELSGDQVVKVLREFEEMQGLRVMITGGEPLVHSKFHEINEMLPDFFIRKVLFTNGVLLKKETLKTLKVDEIQVSIDGLEPAHERLRGSGTFKRSLEAMENALDAGFDVSVSTMVHQYNTEDFDRMEKLFREMQIKDWTVDIPCLTGRLKENDDFYVSPEQGGKYLGYGYGNGLHSSTQGYGCGLHLMAVMANGNIAKCTFYGGQPIGTVDHGLKAAWRNMQPVRLKNLECCCEYLEVCRGGCRYRAELIEGTGGKDPYRCMLYGIL
ncbi:MAG: radical SAM protein [Nitrospirae bacterium]|nr:radical SAM protein [Nitrospirota bacterium]